jgi:enterochelin esterase-like enzyme
MRRMKTRRATKLLSLLFIFLVTSTACAPSNPPLPTPKPPTPISTSKTTTPVPTFEILPTSTPWSCLSKPGRVEHGELDSFKPSQQFLIYLPPCYDEEPDQRYPVLYLLHGQTYTDDQWVRLGAVKAMDELIHSGAIKPFIVVFPDDRYWNLVAGPGFGDRLITAIIPYIDKNYRTLDDREHRAIGGMSRGAGWSLRLGLTHWDLFGFIGLHSLAVMQKDASKVPTWIGAIPSGSRPEIFMDIGDKDQELIMAREIEADFKESDVSHEWHLYSGAHTEDYWSAHVGEYLRWYGEQWNTQ